MSRYRTIRGIFLAGPLVLVVLLCPAAPGQSKGFDPDSTFAGLSLDKAGANSVLKPGEDASAKIASNLFIEGSLSKSSCYVGEDVLLTYRLFSALENTSQVKSFPAIPGANLTELPPGEEGLVRRMIGGKEYRVFTLWQVRLTALKEGRFAIPPLVADNRIRYHAASGQIGAYEGLISSNAVTFRVLPLPRAYTGLIGTYTLQATISPATLQVGNAGNLHLEITGSGNFNDLGTPDIRWPPKVDTFSPRLHWQVPPDRWPPRGSVGIDIAFVPGAQGRLAIPPVVLDYFDPDAGVFKTARTDSIILTVLPGSGTSATPAAGNPRSAAPASWWVIAGTSALLGLGLLAIFVGLRRRRAAAGTGDHATGPTPAGTEDPPADQTPADPVVALHEGLEALLSLEDPPRFYAALRQWLLACKEYKPIDSEDDLHRACDEYLYAGVASAAAIPGLKNQAATLFRTITHIDPYDKDRSPSIPGTAGIGD